MTANQLIDHAMKYFKASATAYSEIRVGIARALNYLEKHVKSPRIRSHMPEGKGRGGYYGLIDWFENENTFKPSFQSVLK